HDVAPGEREQLLPGVALARRAVAHLRDPRRPLRRLDRVRRVEARHGVDHAGAVEPGECGPHPVPGDQRRALPHAQGRAGRRPAVPYTGPPAITGWPNGGWAGAGREWGTSPGTATAHVGWPGKEFGIRPGTRPARSGPPPNAGHALSPPAAGGNAGCRARY